MYYISSNTDEAENRFTSRETPTNARRRFDNEIKYVYYCIIVNYNNEWYHKWRRRGSDFIRRAKS